MFRLSSSLPRLGNFALTRFPLRQATNVIISGPSSRLSNIIRRQIFTNTSGSNSNKYRWINRVINGIVLGGATAVIGKVLYNTTKSLNQTEDKPKGLPIESFFKSFRYDKSYYKNDPDFTRRLNFNYRRRVFVHGDLMIGVSQTHDIFNGKRVPPHILAYNMKTEKMAWGIPLEPTPLQCLSFKTIQTPITPARYRLSRVGDNITLQLMGEQEVLFIQPDTAKITPTLTLPYINNDKSDRLHLTSNGLGYQMVYLEKGRTLVGGKIIDSAWHTSFEFKTPSGFFTPLSTHVGFHEPWQKKLVVFGPSGKHVTIENCLSAKGIGDKLYLIEKIPGQKNKSLLTVRTLTDDEKVVSDVEKSIILSTKEASLEKLCDNGQWILLTRTYDERSPIFVDLNRKKVVYSKHTFPRFGTYKINTASGELWSWDTVSKKIWKISSKETTLLGSLESGRGTSLLHVDQSDHLYFVDIPF